MYGTMVCVAAVVLGVDPGWERLDEGGWRYLIQIDPHTFEELKSGQIEKIESDIPPQLRDIRSYRITIGRGDVPRDKIPPAAVERKLPATVEKKPPARAEKKPPAAATKKPPRSEPGPSASVRPEVPDRFQANAARPLEKPATYSEQVLAKPQLTTTPADDTELSKPWLPFALALAMAFACFGGMLYLGWIALDYRRRYLELFHQMVDAQHAAGV